jgi:hypothetical protein
MWSRMAAKAFGQRHEEENAGGEQRQHRYHADVFGVEAFGQHHEEDNTGDEKRRKGYHAEVFSAEAFGQRQEEENTGDEQRGKGYHADVLVDPPHARRFVQGGIPLATVPWKPS